MTSTTIPPPWTTSLDVENQSSEHYRDNLNLPLLDLIEGAPRRVLELGCAMGHFGAKLKARFPGVEVVGIDANRAAAAVAPRASIASSAPGWKTWISPRRASQSTSSTR